MPKAAEKSIDNATVERRSALVDSSGDLRSPREKDGGSASKRVAAVLCIIDAEEGIQYRKHVSLQHLYSMAKKRDGSESTFFRYWVAGLRDKDYEGGFPDKWNSGVTERAAENMRRVLDSIVT